MMIASRTARSVWFATITTGMAIISSSVSQLTTTALPAFQSGPTVGSLYAGGLGRDKYTNKLLITGISYGDSTTTPGVTPVPQCFVSAMGVSQYDSPEDQMTAMIGRGNVVEACYTLSMIDGTDNFIVSGNSDPGGLYGSSTVPTGFVMAMDYSSFSVQVGRSLDSDQVSYPINIITDPNTHSLYIATLTSTSMEMSAVAQGVANDDSIEPNWLRHRRYGSSFEMTLHRMDYGLTDSDQADVESLQAAWTHHFPIDVNSDGVTKPDVYLAGMILKSDLLIVAGSTAGKGNGYGAAVYDDLDGFLSIIDPVTGDVIEDDRIGTGEDDVIYGICHDPNDASAVYIVGATKGSMSKGASNHGYKWQAFIQKKSTTNLWNGVLWSVQWDDNDTTTSSSKVKAVECLVDGDTVYVAGMSNPYARVEGTDTDNGNDDIFITQLNAMDGTVNWVTEIATDGEDYLADGGALALDDGGNLIVYGNTNGSLYRSRHDSETRFDVFVVTIDRTNGNSPTPGSTSTGGDAPTTHGLLDAIQTGPSVGSVLAGGMVYDAESDRIFLTGSTYDPSFQDGTAPAMSNSSGYFASVFLVNGIVQTWGDYRVYGDPNQEESFSSLVLQGNSDVVIVGVAADGSSMARQSNPGGGITLGIDRDYLYQIFNLPEDTNPTAGVYRFPISITTNGNDMYVVSMTSTGSDFADVYHKLDLVGDVPFSVSRMDAEGPPNVYMTVSRISMAGEGLIHKWSKDFPFEQSDEIPYLSIGGAVVNNEYQYLAVAGSTSGIGPGYGNAVGNDEDGFVTLLDLETGEKSTYVSYNEIREGSAADDIVTGICGGDDPTDDSAFYIVGATRGVIGTVMSQSSEYPIPDGSLQAFLRKVDAKTLTGLWTIQFGAVTPGGASTDPTMMYALDCSVIPGQGLVYVGGVVHDGARVVQGETILASSGGDDLWLGQIDVADGSVRWLEQVGSTGDDRMAPHSGLATTWTGNAVLFGDTNGSFARSRSESDLRDLIVMTFDINGGLVKASANATESPFYSPVASPVASPAASPVPDPTPVESPSPVVAPTPAPVEPAPTPQPVEIAPTPFEVQPGNLTGAGAGSGESVWSGSTNNGTRQEMVGLIVGLVLGFGLFALGSALCICCAVRKKKRAKKKFEENFEEQIKFALEGMKGKDGIFSRFRDDPLSPRFRDDPLSYRDDYSVGSGDEKRFADLRPLSETNLI